MHAPFLQSPLWHSVRGAQIKAVFQKQALRDSTEYKIDVFEQWVSLRQAVIQHLLSHGLFEVVWEDAVVRLAHHCDWDTH